MTVEMRVNCEQLDALMDVQNTVNEYGDDVSIYLTTEATTTRDKYGSIKSHPTTTTLANMKAFPIIFSPNRQQIEKTGIREPCDCMVYTAMKSWTDLGYTFDDIDIIRMTLTVRGYRYNIREKHLDNYFVNQALYVLFALNRI